MLLSERQNQLRCWPELCAWSCFRKMTRRTWSLWWMQMGCRQQGLQWWTQAPLLSRMLNSAVCQEHSWFCHRQGCLNINWLISIANILRMCCWFLSDVVWYQVIWFHLLYLVIISRITLVVWVWVVFIVWAVLLLIWICPKSVAVWALCLRLPEALIINSCAKASEPRDDLDS